MNELEIQEVRLRAYSLWNARGRPEGSPDQDWFDAEQQLRAELKSAALTSTLENLRNEEDKKTRSRRSKGARSGESSRSRDTDSGRSGIDTSAS